MEPWASPEQVSQFRNSIVNLFRITRLNDNVIRWDAPDGNRYFLNTEDLAGNNEVVTRKPNTGEPVMGLKKHNNGVTRMWLSIKGANSIIGTLFHLEDDVPRNIHLATDTKGGPLFENGVKIPAVVIENHDDPNNPIPKAANYMVMTVSYNIWLKGLTPQTAEAATLG